jgi:ABC-type nitrate/sulfonate/bicarbonate transport system substrate-binding protein
MGACCRSWFTVAGAKMNRAPAFFAALILLMGSNKAVAETVVHVGAYPHVTHSQAMVGKANGWFAKALGTNGKVEWRTFNAGRSAIEALFAGAINMVYIGPRSNDAYNAGGVSPLRPEPFGCVSRCDKD